MRLFQVETFCNVKADPEDGRCAATTRSVVHVLCASANDAERAAISEQTARYGGKWAVQSIYIIGDEDPTSGHNLLIIKKD